MNSVKTILAGYKKLETPIINLITAQFFIQIINACFFLLLNYYMVANGYQDYEVTEVLSYRFLSVFLIAFPLGLYIKGRSLKPYFYTSALLVPICSLVIIYAIAQQYNQLLYAASMVWGIGFLCIQITVLPFILLNAKKETHSEAISLYFLTFSVSIFLAGVINTVLNYIDPIIFDEQRVLTLFALGSFISLFFVRKIKIQEQLSEIIPLSKIKNDYDWRLIAKVSVPTLIIAIGAGFTIPVINLFFLKIHGLPSNHFSMLGSCTFFLVIIVLLSMPFIRRRFGYRVAIVLFQSFAVIALFVLATTEYYKDWNMALYIAMAAYIIRQPLMNAAGPMTSEMTMYFVGEKNQELISALNASIWSGSWFVSIKLFGILRQLDLRYVTIFMITVILYAVGVAWYFYLVIAYEKQTGETGIE